MWWPKNRFSYGEWPVCFSGSLEVPRFSASPVLLSALGKSEDWKQITGPVFGSIIPGRVADD